MAGRPRVGVTGNGRLWSPAWWCTRLALRLAGAEPVRISVRHRASVRSMDALVIGGGNDISPEHFGGDLSGKVKADPKRDLLEIECIRWALSHGVPLLGICRGAQLINVVLGGTLHQDIRHLRKRTSNRPGLLPTKRVRLDPDSLVAGVCGTDKLRVNSLHHQAVHRPGTGLTVVGRDRDEIVQAVECVGERPAIGVQWHPEYLLYLPSQFALFRWLVRNAKRE
ncbi:gamma-glutamyl-gamma-aminobutyrate hydrolase family protein [Desulfomicrobium salsuginis]